jgi:hypothetical protein
MSAMGLPGAATNKSPQASGLFAAAIATNPPSL